MTRGFTSRVGETRVTQNGYHQTRTEEGWRYTHHLVAEEKLGRPVTKNERVVFLDGNRMHLKPENIHIMGKGSGSDERRRGQLIVRIEDLIAQLADVDSALASQLSNALRNPS